MKGVHIFSISLFLLLCVGGYFLVKYWNQAKQPDVWKLVPESAILVYESTRSVENWNEIQSKAVWENLEQIPYYASVRTKLELLDSLSGGDGKLHQLLQSEPLVMSVHRVANQTLDYVFFISLDDLSDVDLLSSLVDQYKNRDDFSLRTRTYLGLEIHEAVNLEYEEIFSYIIYQNYFVGSFSPLLVEDVIRNVSGQTEDNFASANPGLFEVAKLDNDQGNIYLNNQKLPQLLSVFADEQLMPEFSPIGKLAQSIFLDFKLTNDKILLNGFAVADPQNAAYLESIGGSQGGSMGFKGILSNEVAVLYHLTFDDPSAWHQRLRSYWSMNNRQQMKQWENLQADLNWDPNELISLQDRELGLAVLGTVEDEKPERLLYLHFSEVAKGMDALMQVAQKAAAIDGDSVYREPYGNTEIIQINLDQFPSRMWGNLFAGFDQSYYMPVEDYLVVSSSISAIKELDGAIQREETWGKSIVKSEFLNNSLQEANMSYYVNLPKAWNLIDQQLSGEWREFLELHNNTLNNFELLAFQFSDIGDKFYTSGVLTYNERTSGPRPVPSFNNNQQVFTRSPIISKPFVVRNHNNGSREVLLQDSLRHLYLIGSQGRTLWQDSLAGSICGSIAQIDYYQNNKLQYLLATENEIHIIDRNGNSIEGYPITVPTGTRLRNVGVIDYDNSKRYRFIASDESGQVFMFNKQGELLEGWNPKVMPDQLLFAPRHIRVRGKDCIIAVQENGIVNIMNRRGDAYPGFPLDLKGTIDGPVFIDQGTDFSTTIFTAITRNGLLLKFDLLGEVRESQQLVKPTPDTYYQLCIDPLEKYLVIKRQNANRLGVLNRKGEVIFEKDYLSTANLTLQYYLLGNNHSIYAVTDPVQQFTYFYDRDGNLINSSPIESAAEIAMLYFENQQQHQIYSVYDNKFALLSF